MLFRVGALLTYLLGSIFTDNFTLVFVITILLLAFDFWTVKNISGRLLVGLRWWNEIQPDGTNKWVFESASVSLYKYDHTKLFFFLYYIYFFSQVESITLLILNSFGGCYMALLHFGLCLHYHVSLP